MSATIEPVADVLLPQWRIPLTRHGATNSLVVEAYGLTPREREVVRGIARGLSTPDIAAELFLSSHTVRDYIKSVFENVGVSSRGELTAKLFAEHHSGALHASLVDVH